MDENFYIEQIAELGELTVWRVDGEKVRAEHKDFTNWGEHYAQDYIPEDEIWIDKEASVEPDETSFYLDAAETEWKLMREGKSYDEAHAVATKRESAQRRKAENIPTGISEEQAGNKIKKDLLGEEDGLQIWLVDGDEVRKDIDIDFTEGGHGLVYNFIPEDEIWLDDDVSDAERPLILLHEKTEYDLMRQGKSYNEAHSEANQIEYTARQKRGAKNMPYTNVPQNLWGKMDSCVEQVLQKQKGLSKESAIAICHKQIVDGKSYFDALREQEEVLEGDKSALQSALKIGARHSQDDVGMIQNIHDAAVRLGAECSHMEGDDGKSLIAIPNFVKSHADMNIALGSEIKMMKMDGKLATVGGYLCSYGAKDKTDLEQDWFSPRTDLGNLHGNGVDTFVNHGIPMAKGLEEFAERKLHPVATFKDKLGLFAKTVLDLSDEYEAMIYELSQKGKLKWSSGALSHLVKRAKDGELLRWIIGEASLTPLPAEWRPSNKVMPIKSYFDMWNVAVSTDSELAEALAGKAARGVEIPTDLRREAELIKMRVR